MAKCLSTRERECKDKDKAGRVIRSGALFAVLVREKVVKKLKKV